MSATRDTQGATERERELLREIAELRARLRAYEDADALALDSNRPAPVRRWLGALAAGAAAAPSALKALAQAPERSWTLRYAADRGEWRRAFDWSRFAAHAGAAVGLGAAVYRAMPSRCQGALRRPRVLHAIPNVWIGGSTQLIVDVVDHTSHLFEHEILTSALPRRGRHRGLDIACVPSPPSLRRIREVFGTFKPEIVHVHYWGDVDLPWYRAVFDVAAEHGAPIVQNVNTPVAPFRGVPVARNVFVSSSVLDTFGSPAPADVIAPGIDLRFFAPRPPAPGAADVFGMVYRLERDKLDESAIALVIAILRRRPATRAVIVGDGALFDPFRDAVRQAGLLDRLEFTGAVPYAALPALYARFGVFLAPVRQESFGQVAPFAMAMGLPVAGRRVGALPEILESDALLGRDVEDTAALVAGLLDDPETARAVGARNRAIALARFGVETMAARYAAVYREVAPHPELDLMPGYPDAVTFPI